MLEVNASGDWCYPPDPNLRVTPKVVILEADAQYRGYCIAILWIESEHCCSFRWGLSMLWWNIQLWFWFLVINPCVFCYIYHLVVLFSRYLVSSTPHTMNKDKIHGRTRTRPSIQKVDPNFSSPVTNISSLSSNYPEVELHLQEIKLDLLFR